MAEGPYVGFPDAGVKMLKETPAAVGSRGRQRPLCGTALVCVSRGIREERFIPGFSPGQSCLPGTH